MPAYSSDEKLKFQRSWLARIQDRDPIGDDELRGLLRHPEWSSAVSDLLGLLASRMILDTAQIDLVLAELPTILPRHDPAYNHLYALRILLDSHLTGLSKLQRFLNLKVDWAALLAIDEIGPYHCGAGIRCVNESTRPIASKSLLCQALTAHRKSMWAEIEPFSNRATGSRKDHR